MRNVDFVLINTAVTLHLIKRKSIVGFCCIFPVNRPNSECSKYVQTLFFTAPWLNSAKEMREHEGLPVPSSSSFPPSPSSSLERQVSVQL